jgi:sugar phosphate permease
VWGWRAGFYLTGALSLLYAILFWITYRNPREAKHLSQQEYTYIVEGGAQRETAPVSTRSSLGFLLRQPKIWGLALGFAAYNYSFYLFLSWLPGYLETALHMSVLKSGFYTIIPWIVATITDIIIGGLLVDMLVKRGRASTNVRRTLIVLGMLLGIAVIGAAFTTNPNVAIAWISVALGGLAFSAPIAWSIPSIIAPHGTVGTVGSIMNFLGNASGIAAPIVAGYIFDRTGSFLLNFLVAGGILVVGILCYLFLLGRIEQIEAPFATREAMPGPYVETPVEEPSPPRKAS